MFESFKNGLNLKKLLGAILIIWFYFFYSIQDLSLSNWTFIDSVDLIFHEAGLTIFFMFGELFRVFAGSFTQVLIPTIIASYFFSRRDYYSMSAILLWVGHSIVNVAIYISDSIVQQLPLLGGDGVIHDWNFILNHFGMLKYTHTISQMVHFSGDMISIIGAVLIVFFSFDNENISEK